MTSQSVVKFYENVNFLGQFCSQKWKCSMESDEKSLVGNRLSFRMMPSKSRLSFSVIEIIALKDKLLFNKNLNFLDQFCTRKLERSMEFDEKSLVGKWLSFRIMPSKIRLSISVIEIIALKDKLLFNKNIKIGNP